MTFRKRRLSEYGVTGEIEINSLEELIEYRNKEQKECDPNDSGLFWGILIEEAYPVEDDSPEYCLVTVDVYFD